MAPVPPGGIICGTGLGAGDSVSIDSRLSMRARASSAALGHCRLDIDVGFFNTRFHAGHHSTSRTNFAQNIEIWDRLFGTYEPVKVNYKSKGE